MNQNYTVSNEISPINNGNNSIGEIISINEAIDRIGFGKFQYRVLIAAGTCFMADSIEIMLLSFLILVLKEEWNLDDNNGAKVASIASAMFAGATIGTLVFGRLGDVVGRKPVLSCCSLMISVFGLGTAFCQGYTSLLLVRFMVGFGIGGLTVPFDVLSEFLPTNSRGKYLLLIEYFWTAGSMSVPIIAYLTLELLNSWRVFVAVCSIPCIVSFVVSQMYVPESPRWLISRGRNTEALAILRAAAAVNGNDPEIVFPPWCILKDEQEESSSFLELLKPKWRSLTLTLWATWFGFAFCYYGAVMTITKIFDNSNGDDADDDGGDTFGFDYLAIFISSTSELVGTALAIALVDRIGRIPTQVCCYSIGGISIFFLCLLADTSQRMILVTIAFIVRVNEMIATCVTWISTSEVLSTEIRTTGHSASNAMARIGGFVCPYLVAGNVSFRDLGIVMILIHFGVAFCASRLPETKGVELGKVMDSKNRNDAVGGAERCSLD